MAPRLVAFGKYLLLDRIAVGGMAEVWLGKTLHDGEPSELLAIKRLLPRHEEDDDFAAMFVDEARIAGRLSHRGIVPIHELGRVGRTLYLAMDLVRGRDLLSILTRAHEHGKPPPPATIAWIGARVCEALHHAHRSTDRDGAPLAVIHRDVSPQNLLVGWDGGVRLIDFGIAKAASRTSGTSVGTRKGKLSYMSPEQMRGAPLDTRTDVFSLGICLYEALAGRALFQRASQLETMQLVRDAVVPPLTEIAPHVPPALAAIVTRALAKDAADRWADASAMQRALEGFVREVDRGYERSTLAAWMRGLFAEDMAREQKRLASLDLVGRPQVRPTSRGLGAIDLLADDDDAETRVRSASPLARVRIESRGDGPYEVLYRRGETRREAPAPAVAPSVGRVAARADVGLDPAELNARTVRALLANETRGGVQRRSFGSIALMVAGAAAAVATGALVAIATMS